MIQNNDNRNLFVAIGLFLLFTVGYNYFFEERSSNRQPEQHSASEEPNVSVVSRTAVNIEQSLAKASRASFENTQMSGSIDLDGAVIDHLVLKEHKQTTGEDSQNVTLLSPKGTENEFFYSISYDSYVDDLTVWKRISDERDKQKVVLCTQTENGLFVERTIAADDEYLIIIEDKLTNRSGFPIKISSTADLFRKNPVINNYAVVHEGVVCQTSANKVEEVKYSDIGAKTNADTGKWCGYTDAYWLIAHVNRKENSVVNFSKIEENWYKCSMTNGVTIRIDPGSTTNLRHSLFVGPKNLKILKKYAKSYNLDKFEMAIDFGWFFIFTKPLLMLLGVMADILGNMGLVILLLTIMFKFLTYPLTKKSLRSATKMKEVQPKIAILQKSYAHDKQRMNQELLALYKKEQISPVSGCFPMLLQAPIFFCLYKVFFISVEMRHAPLFGWIHDLSAPDPAYLFNLFGLLDWMPPKVLQIGAWPLIMGASMFFQQKISSSQNKNVCAEKTQEAKIQERMMYALPALFTYVCASFPVGVTVYWTISNIFSIIQQYYVNKSIVDKKQKRV
jgi:YidC/Oxa1 family membrane protein insertase